MNSLILYILVFACSSCCISFSESNNLDKKAQILLLGAGIVLPALIAGSRSPSVGTDTANYLYEINRIGSQSLDEVLGVAYSNYEIGFRLICKSLMVFGNASFVLGALNALTLLFAYFGIREFCRHNMSSGLAYFTLLCLYWGDSLNITRQALAAAICFFALKFLLNGKRPAFVFIVAIAASIHLSSAAFLLTAVLWNREKPTSLLRRLTLVFAALLIASALLLSGYTAESEVLKGFFSKYAYLFDYVPGGNRGVILAIIITFAMSLTWAGFRSEESAKIRLVIALFGIGTAFQLLGLNNKFFKRLALCYSLPSVTWFANLKAIANSEESLLVVMLVLTYDLAYFVITAFVIGNGEIFPYVPLWG